MAFYRKANVFHMVACTDNKIAHRYTPLYAGIHRYMPGLYAKRYTPFFAYTPLYTTYTPLYAKPICRYLYAGFTYTQPIRQAIRRALYARILFCVVLAALLPSETVIKNVAPPLQKMLSSHK